MRVLMIVIMCMLVWLRHFGLLLCSLIRLCHLSRGQIHAFQEASVVCRVVRNALASAVYASLLLYEPSIERVKPQAVLPSRFEHLYK